MIIWLAARNRKAGIADHEDGATVSVCDTAVRTLDMLRDQVRPGHRSDADVRLRVTMTTKARLMDAVERCRSRMA